MADAADWVAVTTAVVGSVVAGASVWIALRARDEARRSADAAEEANQLQRHERHETLAPPRLGVVDAKLGLEGEGMYVLHFWLRFERDYRMRMKVLAGSVPQWSPARESVARVGEHSIDLERDLTGAWDATVKRVRFDFWPPAEVDGVQPWTCPCGEPPLPDVGHWWWEADVWFAGVGE